MIDYLIEDLIRKGEITQEDFDKLVEKHASNPDNPKNKLAEVKSHVETVEAEGKVTNEHVVNLDDRTVGMQEIDFYTLDQTFIINDRTEGMQDIDQFTLDLVFVLQAKIDELEQRIITLEGGI